MAKIIISQSTGANESDTVIFFVVEGSILPIAFAFFYTYQILTSTADLLGIIK